MKSMPHATGNRDETLDTLSTGGIRIFQLREGYRFSLDSLILPFFLEGVSGNSLIELGAGSGVISMIVARRFREGRLVAVEIQRRLYDLLTRNLSLNGLSGRIEAVLGDVRETGKMFEPGEFDRVFSNPPFRRVRSGRMSSDPEKAMARHEVLLTLEELVRAAEYLLAWKGKFSLIYLPERLAELIAELRRRKLEPKRMRTIHSFPGSPPVLILMEAVKGARPGMLIEAPFVIYRDRSGRYTDEMQAIYDFTGE